MRPRNTIIALILFAIIGGYAFIMARYSVPEEHRKLINLKPEQMAEIELKSADRDIVIRREKDKPWMLIKPIGTDADQFQCNNLAHAISETELVRTVEEKLEHVAAGHGIVVLPLSTATFYTRADISYVPVRDIPPNHVCLGWDSTRRSRLIREYAAIAADQAVAAERVLGVLAEGPATAARRVEVQPGRTSD